MEVQERNRSEAYEKNERNVFKAFSSAVGDLEEKKSSPSDSGCKFLVLFCFGDQNSLETPSLRNLVPKTRASIKGRELGLDDEKSQVKFVKQSNNFLDRIAKKSKMEEEEFRSSLEVCEKSFVHFLFITSSLEQIKGEKMLKLVKTAKRSKLIELTRTKFKLEKTDSSLSEILDFF